MTHWPTLVFEADDGDLCRCDCGEQGYDFQQGRKWFAEHLAVTVPLDAPESFAERRAWFVYEGARYAAAAARAPIVPEPWFQRDEAFRAQFIHVIDRQCGADRQSSPADLHADWVRAYETMGWTYGPERDTAKRTHPDMVPYDELGQLERDKDAVFVALCEIARQWVYTHLPEAVDSE